ncbi:MAG: phage major capsid protein, partial [Rhodospirillales bacterium]
LETNEAQPDVVVMHPTDFRAMQRVKASGSGEFLFGAPSGQNTANVWNTDIHTTPAMTQGKFLAMDSVQMGVLFLREDASVQVGYVNDDFTKNLVVLLSEIRATIAVQRPAAVQYGSLTL